MAPQLKPDEPLAKGIRRIVRKQIDKALDGLTGLNGAEPEEVVHDARKRFKRIRAVLRLARVGLGRKLYERENARFRDAGRPLSEVRDAGVLVEAFDQLVEQSGSSIQPESAGAIRSVLSDRKQEVCRRVLQEEKAFATVTATLQEARACVKRWDIEGDDWPILKGGLRIIYRDGHRAFVNASDDPTDENLHQWRKRVKDVWYVLDVLQPVRPSFTEARGEQAHKLADALGDDHDLAVLRQLLSDPDGGLGDHATAEAILPMIDRRRSELQRDAFASGPAVFPERPQAFVARFGAYWQAWRSEIEAAQYG
jgi:CHAD domain-containing protein